MLGLLFSTMFDLQFKKKKKKLFIAKNNAIRPSVKN